MIELSASAKKSLDEYLRQVRAYLRWSKTTDPGEVEQNITEHIENELGDTNSPISLEALNAVLSRLGRPWQWVPQEELPWWRRVILKLWIGPEYWGLAYLSFGLLVVGFLVSRDIEGIIVCIVASSLTGRASLESVEKGEELGAQRWLIYPSLILAYLGIIGGLFSGIGCGGYALAEVLYDSGVMSRYADMGEMFILASITSFVVSVGLILLGLILRKWPGLVRGIFRPFGDWFERRHGVALIAFGFVVNLIVVLGTLYWAHVRL